GPHLSAREPVVGNLRIGHPDREDGTAGDPSLEPRLTPLPASAGVDELAIVDLRALQKERADARPERVLDAEMMEVRVRIVPAVDGAVHLRSPKGQVRDGDIRSLVLEPDQIGLG